MVFALLGVRFATHAPANPVGWLMLTVGVFATLSLLAAAWSSYLIAAWLDSWIWLPGYTIIPVLAVVFPTGRPVSPPWWSAIIVVGLGTVLMAVGLGAAAWPAPRTFWTDAVEGRTEPGAPTALIAVGLSLFALGALVAVVSLIVRCIRQPATRPIVGWAAVCTASALVAGALEATVSSFWWLAALAFPLAAVVSVLRHGLFDIELIVHRSLLFGLLSVALIVLYAGAALGASRLVPGEAQAAATVVVVLAVFPLRAVVQRRVDHWLYGARTEPYQNLSDLGRRFEEALGVDDVLPALAEHVAAALRAPYVRASVISDSPRGVVEVGRRRGWPETIVPLTFRGRQVGEIKVEARAPDERYHAGELRLLHALAGTSGAAAHAVALTGDLRMARERLVLAREEERRRLRHDLHDTVGAGLAGTLLQVRTASRRLPDVERAAPLLVTATRDLTDLTAEVRRVVDGLRPASLDQGLVAALRALGRPYAGTGLVVLVSIDEQITGIAYDGGLPAAVEVAAYQIAREALANVARHARARHCTVTGAVQESVLRLEIADDGVGLAATAAPDRAKRRGLGLESMRQRAVELGGRLEVEESSHDPAAAWRWRGVRVVAWLPLAETAGPVTAGAETAGANPGPTGEWSRCRG